MEYIKLSPKYGKNHDYHRQDYEYYKRRNTGRDSRIDDSPLEARLKYKINPKIDYPVVKDDFFRHIPSLPIVYMRPEQMGGALGMIYIDSNYMILRDTLFGKKKLEVEVHEAKHWMDKMKPERYIREDTRNMFEETFFH